MSLTKRIQLLAMLLTIAIFTDIPLWFLSSMVSRWGSLENWLLVGLLYFLVSLVSSVFFGFILTSRLTSYKASRLGFEMTVLSFSLFLMLNVLLSYEIWVDGVSFLGFLIGFVMGAKITEVRRRLESKVNKQDVPSV